MKPYIVGYSPRVREEIKEIAHYISIDSIEAAAEWLGGFFDALETLETMPERCPLIPENDEFQDDLRERLFHSHRIIFLVGEQRVQVVHVRHMARSPLKRGEGF